MVYHLTMSSEAKPKGSAVLLNHTTVDASSSQIFPGAFVALLPTIFVMNRLSRDSSRRRYGARIELFGSFSATHG
jgi:hypothetical protein